MCLWALTARKRLSKKVFRHNFGVTDTTMNPTNKSYPLNNRTIIRSVVLFLLILSFSTAFSQNTSRKLVKLLRADVNEFDKAYMDAQRVKGNVVFEYEGTMFYCDSAHIFKNKDFDAFGAIRVTKPGSFQLNGKYLHVDQQKKLATITESVVLRDNQMTLTGNKLMYHIDSEIASYTGGARIVSNANNNVLTSREGSYHTKTETFYFRNKVVLKNPDYQVESDTLKYNDATEVAYFYGPTTITGDDTEIYCENGWYNTQKDICQFNRHAWVRSQKTILKGDSIYYNGEKGLGEVFRNISIRDTTSNIIISGEYGIHYEKTKESIVTEKALMTQIFEAGDSLFMHADTLRSIPDSSGKDQLFAFHHVKFFKQDFQGMCDSLSYTSVDSTLHLFKDPVLWSEQNQITGDSIWISNKDRKIDRMIVRGNSFIISENTPKEYNQIKGRNMDASFVDNALHSVYIEGNGQLIYFPQSESKTENEKPKTMGLNKGDCSNIYIEIKDNDIVKLRMEQEANNILSPLKMANPANFTLDGFDWLAHLRPISKDSIFE